MQPPSILLISTDSEAIAALQRVAHCLPARLRVAASPSEATKAMQVEQFEAVLVQVDDGHPGGPTDQCVLTAPSPVIAVARSGSIAQAVRTVQAGAIDYFPVLPPDPAALAARLRAALRGGAQEENDCERLPSGPSPFSEFITLDGPTLSACRTAWRLADTGVVLWLSGETGTGKSLLARQVHLASGRRFGRFVEVNCGLLTPAQLFHELFGNAESAREAHEAGALKQAAGGTLLLVEPAGLDVAFRDNLLRALEGEGQPDAGCPSAPEVRLMLASNRCADPKGDPLLSAIYDRRDVVSVQLPPLRDRIVDVPVLARHFMRLSAARHGHRTTHISLAALSAIVRHQWPGNVRELKAAMEFSVLLARQGAVEPEHLPEAVRASDVGAGHGADGRPLSLKRALLGPERSHILRALRITDWNKLRAARRLRISRSTLYKKLREHGLEPEPQTAEGGGPVRAGRALEAGSDGA